MRIPLAGLLALLLVSLGLASEHIVVSRIDVTGRRYTREWVIRRELRFTVGDTVTTEDLDAARKRLLSLGQFNRVAIDADSMGTVTVAVVDQWPVLPELGLELSEGQVTDALTRTRHFFKSVTLLTGLAHHNFQGEGAYLAGRIQVGSATGFGAEYYSRWFKPNLPYEVTLQFQNLRIFDRHASVLDSTGHLRDVRYVVEVGTHAGAPAQVALQVWHETVRPEDGFIGSLHKKMSEFFVSPTLTLDHRDLEWYPSRGGFAQIKSDFAFGTADFIRSSYNLRGYFPFGETIRSPVLALAASVSTSTNATPVWGHYFHGFDSGFRGYMRNQTESANVWSGDVALRCALTDESYYDVPILGEWGKRWPFAIYGELFGERAELSMNGGRRDYLASGAGLMFRFPYVQLFEVAAVYNGDRQINFELTTGVFF